jgi:hypothetical protein
VTATRILSVRIGISRPVSEVDGGDNISGAECAGLGESGSGSDDGDAEEKDDREAFVLGIRKLYS